ncbi:MAG: LptF/LptG family permease [Treponemataceae bacterium]|nr:LptF/LptG family permease [Treponemataceae bacterium]
MKLVVYLFRRFLPIFFGALGFFSLVLVLVDLLMNLWKFIQNEAPALQVAYLMLLYIPKTIWYAIPLGILFAVSYTLSDLYANNELTAVFASGVSLLRFTMPLLVFSVVMSFALFFFEDNVVVPTYAHKQQLQGTLLQEEKSLNNDSIVVLSDNGFIVYKANLYDDAQRRLYDLYLVCRNQDKSLDAIIHADYAVWDEASQLWLLRGAIQYAYGGEGFSAGSVREDLAARLNEPCETFRNNTVSVEEVNTAEAKVYINHLRRVGLPFNEELSVYYKKFSFPCIVFIVVFLSIGLSGKSRKNVLLISLSLSICAAVLFYVMQMITMLLAKFGYISPFAGAWFPVFFFIFLSILFLRYART